RLRSRDLRSPSIRPTRPRCATRRARAMRPTSSATSPRSHLSPGLPPGRSPGERCEGLRRGGAPVRRGAMATALLFLFSTSALAAPVTVTTKRALCAAACQAQTAVLCGGLIGPEAERCGEALESACRRGNPGEVCAITNAEASTGAVVCQKPNGL